MEQIYKVFYKNKCLIVGGAPNDVLVNALKINGLASSIELKKELDYFFASDTKYAVLQQVSGRIGVEILEKIFPCIIAGGGIVKNEEGTYLLIYRRGFWDLPKGKIDEGESVESGAIREVEEECHVLAQIIDPMPIVSYHFYEHKSQLVLKKTYWFAMKSNSQDVLIPQLEEDITELGYYAEEEVNQRLAISFPNLQDVWLRYRKRFIS